MGLILCLSVIFCVDLISAEIVCPVCGRPFPDTVETCPNDGSDLTIVGQLVDASVDETDTESDTDSLTEVPEAEEPEASVKYKRRDVTISRPAEPATDDADYRDRRSRVIKERRGPIYLMEQRRRRRARALEQDRRLRAQFDLRREQYLQNRDQLHDLWSRARSGSALATKRRLYGMSAPLASVGYRITSMGEGDHFGPLSAVEIDLNLTRKRTRIGLSTAVGVRALETRNELVFIEHLSVGLQYPWRYSPYILLRGGIGALASERFDRKMVYFLSSVGGEVGIDCWITPWIALTPSLGYTRYIVDQVYWNSFSAKLSLGF